MKWLKYARIKQYNSGVKLWNTLAFLLGLNEGLRIGVRIGLFRMVGYSKEIHGGCNLFYLVLKTKHYSMNTVRDAAF